MTPQAFKANPAIWQESTNLEQMLLLLQHLANDGNVTVALLAADFAERTLPNAGANQGLVLRCVTAVRTWAKCPTSDNLQECKDATHAAAHAASSANATAAYASSAYAYSAAAANATAAYDASAAYAAYAASSSAADAAYSAAAAAYSAAAAGYAYSAYSAATRQAEQNWQLAHIRAKHPLTEL